MLWLRSMLLVQCWIYLALFLSSYSIYAVERLCSEGIQRGETDWLQIVATVALTRAKNRRSFWTEARTLIYGENSRRWAVRPRCEGMGHTVPLFFLRVSLLKWLHGASADVASGSGWRWWRVEEGSGVGSCQINVDWCDGWLAGNKREVVYQSFWWPGGPMMAGTNRLILWLGASQFELYNDGLPWAMAHVYLWWCWWCNWRHRSFCWLAARRCATSRTRLGPWLIIMTW